MATKRNAAAEQFVRKVKESLSDLPENTVNQLTDGLVEDISERLAEGGSKATLGNPLAFAAELRESAGLAERVTQRYQSKLWKNIKPGFYGFFRSLVPIWWVLRVFILYEMARMLPYAIYRMPFGQEFHPFPDPDVAFEWWIIAALCIVSVQWGRGRWGITKMRWAIVPVNALIVLLAVPFTALTGAAIEQANHDRMLLEGQWIIVNGFVVPEPHIFDKDGNELQWDQLRNGVGDILYRNK